MGELEDIRRPLSKEDEKEWDLFWRPIVMRNGVLDLDLVKRELLDFSDVIQEVSIVYDTITGGRISKPNTKSYHVIDAADEHYKRLLSDEPYLSEDTVSRFLQKRSSLG